MDEAALRDSARRLVDTLGGRRRLVAAALLAVAALAGLKAVTPKPLPTVTVWAAAHDLSGGRSLALTDLTKLALPAAAVPAGALRPTAGIVGRLLAAPVRRGEPLTDVRLLGPSLLATLPGLVAIPIRVADGSAAAAVVKAGDLVDVLEVADPATGGPRHPRTVASKVPVLTVPSAGDGTDGAGLVVLAATPTQAAALAQASAGARLTLTIENQ